jgi:hypothetical protein
MRHKAAMPADSIPTPATPTLAEARATLERVWGHADFRGRQAEVVAEVLAGRDVLAGEMPGILDATVHNGREQFVVLVVDVI